MFKVLKKLQKILAVQKKRYQQKGLFNTLLALMLLFGIYFAVWYTFGIVWPSNIQNKELFVAYNSIIVHTLAQLIILVISLPGYLGWKAYKEFQVNNKWNWPWQTEGWNQVLKKILLNLFVNDFILYPIPCILSTFIGIDVRFEGFPSLFELFCHTQLLFFLDDFIFYWSHKCFHESKSLYKFHKVHHEFEHQISLGSQYSHPIEFIMSSLLPTSLAILLMGNRLHCFSAFVWIGYRVLFTSQSHCGYSFPWSPLRVLPLVADVEYHDNHHTQNVGNYSVSTYIYDIMFGTEGPYLEEFLQKN